LYGDGVGGEFFKEFILKVREGGGEFLYECVEVEVWCFNELNTFGDEGNELVDKWIVVLGDCKEHIGVGSVDVVVCSTPGCKLGEVTDA
jgi:hypothetical protein